MEFSSTKIKLSTNIYKNMDALKNILMNERLQTQKKILCDSICPIVENIVL